MAALETARLQQHIATVEPMTGQAGGIGQQQIQVQVRAQGNIDHAVSLAQAFVAIDRQAARRRIEQVHRRRQQATGDEGLARLDQHAPVPRGAFQHSVDRRQRLAWITGLPLDIDTPRVALAQHVHLKIAVQAAIEAFQGVQQGRLVTSIKHQHRKARRLRPGQAFVQARQLPRPRVALAQPVEHAASIAGRLAPGRRLGLGNEGVQLLPERRRALHVALQGAADARPGPLERIGLVEHGETDTAEEAGVEHLLIHRVPRHEDHRAAAQRGNHAGHGPLIGVQHLGPTEHVGQLRQGQGIGHTQQLDIGRQLRVVDLLERVPVLVEIGPFAHGARWRGGEQRDVEGRQAEQVDVDIATRLGQALGVIEDQVVGRRLHALAGDEAFEVQHVARHHRTTERVAAGHLGVDRDRYLALCQVTLDDLRIMQGCLEVRVDHIGAADVRLAPAEVEHVAEVVHRDDAGRGVAVGGRKQVVRVLGLGKHQPQA